MTTIYDLVRQARAAAHAKHGDHSIEALPADDPRWLPILVEEVGEVAHELTYDQDGTGLRDELIQVAAVAIAWAEAASPGEGWPLPGDNADELSFYVADDVEPVRVERTTELFSDPDEHGLGMQYRSGRTSTVVHHPDGSSHPGPWAPYCGWCEHGGSVDRVEVER